MKNKLSIPIIIVVIVILLAAGFWYWSHRNVQKPGSGAPAPSGVYSQEKTTGGLGGNIFEKSQNPISDKLPQTNPFGGNVNPFGSQTNPYKDTYKNPFK